MENLFERIMKSVDKEDIVFDEFTHEKRIFKLSNNMRITIRESLRDYCLEADEIYSDLFEKKEYNKYDYYEELVDGPVRFVSYYNPKYPQGYVHAVEAGGVLYTLDPENEDIIITGSYNYFYSLPGNQVISNRYNTYTSPTIDTLGICNYEVKVTKSGYIKKMSAMFRTMDKPRNSGFVLADRGYLKFDFDTRTEFKEFIEKLNDRDFALGLFKEKEVEKISR